MSLLGQLPVELNSEIMAVWRLGLANGHLYSPRKCHLRHLLPSARHLVAALAPQVVSNRMRNLLSLAVAGVVTQRGVAAVRNGLLGRVAAPGRKSAAAANPVPIAPGTGHAVRPATPLIARRANVGRTANAVRSKSLRRRLYPRPSKVTRRGESQAFRI